MDAALPHGLKFSDVRQQLRFLRVQAIAEQMNFGVVVLGGKFGAGDEINPRRLARRVMRAQPSTESWSVRANAAKPSRWP